MRRKDLTTNERNLAVQFLLQNHSNGKLVKGCMKEAAEKFGITRQTVTRLWAAEKKKQSEGVMVVLQSAKIKNKRNILTIDVELLKKLPILQRGSIRSLAVGLGVTKTSVGRWVQRGLIKAHTSALKPDLTAANKLLRLRFTLEAIEFDRMLNILKFRTMDNTVHIDEKWFYITKLKHRMYMALDEQEPQRTCQNKGFIPIIMFMCAVCRPLFAEDGSVLFDGKIGIFPFTEQKAAIRDSKKRKKDTLETKPIDSITKNVIKDCIINQILPYIKMKWPLFASSNINIQQDNARPHISDNDVDFRKAASADGFNIRLVHQPPNSPYTNINDLGWFRAIQSLQHETSSYNADSLVAAVQKSYDELSPVTLNNVFLSLQGCMTEILKVKGQNSYKIPHMKKAALIRQGNLPLHLVVNEALVRDCIMYLMKEGKLEGIQGLMQDMGINPE